MSGNQFLDSAARQVSEFKMLDKAKQESVKKLVEAITAARDSEAKAIAQLYRFVDCEKAVSATMLIDGTTSTNVYVIKQDINARTSIAVAKLTAAIREMHPSWTNNLSEKTEQMVAESGSRLGRAFGKFLHAPVDAQRRFSAEFKRATKASIGTRCEELHL